LKVVNPGSQMNVATIQLQGAGQVESSAKATVITGKGDDVNTFEKENIAPRTATINNVGPEFRFAFYPRSITVLRIGTHGAKQ